MKHSNNWLGVVPLVSECGVIPGSWLEQALADALKRDPVDAANDAAVLYHLLSKSVTDERPSEKTICRTHPIPCWVCNSVNTQLVGTPGYGILLKCGECGDVFEVEDRILWERNPPETWLNSEQLRHAF